MTEPIAGFEQRRLVRRFNKSVYVLKNKPPPVPDQLKNDM